MRRIRTVIAAAAAAAVAVTLACIGCTVTADKAGGEEDVFTLTFANPYSHLDYVPQVEVFLDEVESVSNGSLEIEVADEWGGFQPGFEEAAIKAVADGEIDLAWVGTRAFDLVGENALQALTAPFLVDSEELEQAILDSGLPQRMMNAMDVEGLEPVTILAGGLRRPFSVDAPLTSLAAFDGITFQSFESKLNAQTTSALGATPQHATPSGLDADLSGGATQGYEKQFSTVLINGTQRLSPYVASNVVLWPETIAIVGNADRLAQLSDRQRAWLDEAARAASTKSVAALPDDAEGLALFCAGGARAAAATPDDLLAFLAAVEPVYDELRVDPDTAGFLDEIAELKEQTKSPGLTIPDDCTGDAAIAQHGTPSADPEAEAIEGVYRWEITAEAAEAAGRREDPRYPWPHILTMTLEVGRWNHHVRDAKQEADYGGGPYTVDGDELVLTWDDSGLPMHFTFEKLANGNLQLTPAPSLGAEDAFVIASQEWVRIE